MNTCILILALLITPQAPPSLEAAWLPIGGLHVRWTAPGWHCVYLDGIVLDCRNDQADLLLLTGGVDHLYAPHPGQTLRLIDASANETARVVVPARVYRVVLNWVRR